VTVSLSVLRRFAARPTWNAERGRSVEQHGIAAKPEAGLKSHRTPAGSTARRQVMSVFRTSSISLKALAVAISLLTAASGMTIPTVASAQGFRQGHFRGGAVRGPGFRSPGAFRPAPGLRVAPGFRRGPAFRPGAIGVRPAYRAGFYRNAGVRRAYPGVYRPAYRYRPIYGAGYYRPAYRRAVYSSPYYGGYYPVGGYYPYGGYSPYGGYYDNGGGAVAAALFGAIALGTIAAASRQAAYRPVVATGQRCFYERRRVATRQGKAVIRRVRSCY
jgi:hypothetical protein